jgi:phosphatidylglycerophosphate synthase
LLAGPADELAARGINPDALFYTALGCVVASVAAVAFSHQAPWLLVIVPVLAAARIGLNALDWMVAQRRGLTRRRAKLLDEVCDRLGDLRFFAGLFFVPGEPGAVLGTALLAALLASYVGVVAEAAGSERRYGRLVGKADRVLSLSVACAAAWTRGRFLALQFLPLVILVGSLMTIVQRGRAAYASLQTAR